MKQNDSETLNLLSNFTHQIINPLNGVIGTLDNLIDGTISGPRVEQRLRSARGQLECSVSLIRNLVFFAEYSADFSYATKSRMDRTCILPQIIIEAAQFFQEAGLNKSVKIELLNREDQNAVHGNPDLLRQVFMNIFDNGIKYGLPGTTIQVKDWIKQTGSQLICTISGPSIGFGKDEDIFQIGIRGRAAVEKAASGTGLGLHICKLIVERVFEGKIRAQHVAGTKMTTFELRLPRAFKNRK